MSLDHHGLPGFLTLNPVGDRSHDHIVVRYKAISTAQTMRMCMTKSTMVLLVFLSVVLTAAQALSYSASELTDMKSVGGCDKKLSDGYILGIAESLAQHKVIKLPGYITYDKIVGAVYWYISSNPEVGQEPAAVVVENALREASFKNK